MVPQCFYCGAENPVLPSKGVDLEERSEEDSELKVLSVLANPRSVEDSACLKIECAFREALMKQRPDAVFDKIDVYRDEIPLLDVKLLPVFWGAKPPDA